MQLVCPKCESSYAVADGALGEKGRSVRCVRCKNVWFATPAQPAMAEAVGVEVEPAAAPKGDMPEPPASIDAAAEATPPIAPTDAAPPHLDDAPPLAPVAPEPEVEVDAGEKADYFDLRRRREAFKKARKALGWSISATHVAVVLSAVLVAVVYERETIVRVMPQTASLYSMLGLRVNLRGLAFASLKTTTETQDGIPVLVIEGEIRNVTAAIQQVPRLRFALRNDAGAEIYTWTGTPDRNLMAPGDVQGFRTRLASPPGEGRDARVRFLQPRDTAAVAKH